MFQEYFTLRIMFMYLIISTIHSIKKGLQSYTFTRLVQEKVKKVIGRNKSYQRLNLISKEEFVKSTFMGNFHCRCSGN